MHFFHVFCLISVHLFAEQPREIAQFHPINLIGGVGTPITIQAGFNRRAVGALPQPQPNAIGSDTEAFSARPD